MAPDKEHNRYDPAPPIPTYEEAVSRDGRWHPHSPTDDRFTVGDDDDAAAEGQSLLNTRHPFHHDQSSSSSSSAAAAVAVSNHNRSAAAARRNGGYRQPTVESDDDDSLFGSEGDETDDEAEAAHVRREMQEMEIMDGEEGGRSRNLSAWGKRIGFGISLPAWRWKWNWRVPRFRIRLGEDVPSSSRTGDANGGDDDAPRTRRPWLDLLSGMPSTIVLQIVGRLLAILIIMGSLYLVFMSDLFSNIARKMGTQVFDPESVRIYVQGTVNPQNIRQVLEHFTGYGHIAGTEGDFALALDTRKMFEEYGLEDVTVDEYKVYLNFAIKGGRAVEIMGADDTPIWSAKLEEEDPGDEKFGNQTFAFHGHSKSGDVKGPLIYANYGSRDDFKVLYDSGIDTKGAIALVRYYGTEGDRALKVKAAELAGFAGCIIYSDPMEDGFLRGETAPKGRYMPADGVQRGAVSLMSWVVGDVLTPGWASKPNMPRMKVDQTPGLVKIPSLPLSWRDAQVLLQHIRGFGQKVPSEWVGGVPDIGDWWTGNLSSPIVHLKNEQDEGEKEPIWNVYGRINGVEQGEKKIIVGNHRDAWGFGAADPGSGTAVMMEVARIFGSLLARGWRPQRTIEFMSWDGEEYNLIGSTEYVEQNDEALRQNGWAYINLDTAVTGDTFRAAGSPVFRKLLLQIMNRVSDPNYNTTLRDLWDRRKGELEGLGAGSDYVAFQDIVGTSSLDLRFESDPFPYHSSYENFEWMDTVIDPGFVYHAMLAQVLALLVLELAERPIVPFDMTAYADSLTRWVGELITWSENKGLNQEGNTPLDMTILRDAADEVAMAVREFTRWEMTWESSVVAGGGWESSGLGKRRCEYNSRMAAFETDLLDDAGVPNRTQFKHVIFGPQLWSGYDEAFFPSIRDTITAGEWTLANQTVEKVASIIKQAAANLIKQS